MSSGSKTPDGAQGSGGYKSPKLRAGTGGREGGRAWEEIQRMAETVPKVREEAGEESQLTKKKKKDHEGRKEADGVLTARLFITAAVDLPVVDAVVVAAAANALHRFTCRG